MAKKIISVINQKGGTGKTTTTINLGSALAKSGKKVLLVDLDPQSNLSYSLGISAPEFTIADLFTGQKNTKEVIIKKDGLSVIPGSTELVDIELSLVTEKDREQYLKQILADSGSFDYILIDCPPSLSLLTVNALVASAQVLIPLQMEVLTLQGLDQILATISKIKNAFNPALNIKGIVVVMYDQRRKLSQEILDYLHENINEKVFDSRIRVNVKIAEAPSFGQSVLDYQPASTGAQDYMALAREFTAT